MRWATLKKHWLYLSLGLSFVLYATGLSAETVVIVSRDGKVAWYAGSASSEAVKADRVLRLTTTPDGPGDPPTNPSKLSELSSTWKTKVPDYTKRDKHRRALAVISTVLSGRVKNGTITSLEQLEEESDKAQTLILGSDKEKWDTWGKDIGVYFEANVKSLESAASAYLDVAAGLQSGQAALDPIIIAIIVEIITLLLEDSDSPFLQILLRLFELFG